MKEKILKLNNLLMEIIWLFIFFSLPLFFLPSIIHGTWQIAGSFLFQVLVEILCFLWLMKICQKICQGRTLSDKTSSGVESLQKNSQKILQIFPAIFFIFILGLSTIFSQTFYYSFWGSYARKMGYLIWLHFFVFFLILYFNLESKKQIERIFYIIVATVGVVVFYGFLQTLGFDFWRWSASANFGWRVFSTFGQPNFLASWLLLTIFVVFWLIIHYSHKQHLYLPLFSTFVSRRVLTPSDNKPLSRGSTSLEVEPFQKKPPQTSFIFKNYILRPIFICLLFLTLIIFILTQSRSGWLGLFLSGLFFAIVFTWRKRDKKLFFVFIGIFLLFIISIFIFNLHPLQPKETDNFLVYRLKTLSNLTEFGKLRILWWRNSLDLIKRKPLLGYGLETQELNFVKYYQPEYAALEGINQLPDRAHNDFLDMLLTSGILGLISYMFLIVGVFWQGLKYVLKVFKLPNPRAPNYPNAEFSSFQFIVLILLSGLFGYLFSLQFSFHVISTSVYFWAYLAIILKISSGDSPPNVHS